LKGLTHLDSRRQGPITTRLSQRTTKQLPPVMILTSTLHLDSLCLPSVPTSLEEHVAQVDVATVPT